MTCLPIKKSPKLIIHKCGTYAILWPKSWNLIKRQTLVNVVNLIFLVTVFKRLPNGEKPFGTSLQPFTYLDNKTPKIEYVRVHLLLSEIPFRGIAIADFVSYLEQVQCYIPETIRTQPSSLTKHAERLERHSVYSCINRQEILENRRNFTH